MSTNNDDQQSAAPQQPTYGEYATPEQQRAAAGLPPETAYPQAAPYPPVGEYPTQAAPIAPAEGAPSYLPPIYPEQPPAAAQPPAGYPPQQAYAPGYAPVADPQQQYAQGYPAGYPQAYPAYPQYGQVPPGYAARRLPGKANLIWTIVLLVFGAFSIWAVSAAYLSPALFIQEMQRMPEFDGVNVSVATLAGAGRTAVILLWVTLAIAVALSAWLIHKKKYSWWVPLAFGAVFQVVAFFIFMGPILSAIPTI